MKKCNKCEFEKPEAEFYMAKGRPESMCKKCRNADSLARYYTNHAEEKAKRIARSRANYAKNREYYKSKRKEGQARNRVAVANWKKKNPAEYVALKAKRRAAEKNAIPEWANTFFIGEAYRLANLRTKMFGFKWHVDHVVPLQHRLVCGLHVEHNLRVIPAAENQAKGNRYWPDMPA